MVASFCSRSSFSCILIDNNLTGNITKYQIPWSATRFHTELDKALLILWSLKDAGYCSYFYKKKLDQPKILLLLAQQVTAVAELPAKQLHPF